MGLADLFSKAGVKAKVGASSRVVGIDIGSSSIKVVELESRDDVITLTTYGELELGPYDEEKPVGQSVVLAPNIERQALVDILRESAVKARQAVFAMPLASSFVTVMNLETTADEDITPRVRVEARKYIPVPIAEVTLDWAEVESPAANGTTSRDVLLAAIQNDALKRFTTLMETVEFPNSPTEIECFSTIRSVYNPEETDVAIVDVGAVSTQLYLVRNGLLQRMYRVRAGGSIFTEKIATQLGISFGEAETLKRSITPTSEQFAALQKIQAQTFDRPLKEFRQVLDEYESRISTNVGQIYVIGGGASFAGIVPLVASVLGRQATLATPFNKVAYPAFMEDTMNTIGSSFAVALGAALRSFE